MVNTGLVASRWQAKKDIKAGAVYMNEQKVSDMNQEIEFKNGICLLRKGKKKYAIIIN